LVLKKQAIIRVFTAGIMLLLFTLSIMPKLYLHEIFATHKDIVTNTAEPGFSKNGYTCDVNDLVATSPFTEAPQQYVTNPDIYFPVLHTRYTSQIATAAPDCFTLRGPPAIA
jgi:hypothetical protein